MTAIKFQCLWGALALAQAGVAGADTMLEERIIVLEERMDGVQSGNTHIDFGGFITVSYTHLTLPTICSV